MMSVGPERLRRKAMNTSAGQLLRAWKEVLRLSKVKAGEAVTLLTSTNTNLANHQAAELAATELGAAVSTLTLPPMNGERSLSRDQTAYVGVTALKGNRAAMAALQNSDMVIDLMLLLFSPEQAKILESGTRVLLAVEPPEILTRIVPTLDDKRRVMAAEARLKRGKTMTVESKAGTQLRCRLARRSRQIRLRECVWQMVLYGVRFTIVPAPHRPSLLPVVVANKGIRNLDRKPF
jgi:2,5-dihydroxypyridine 5,6-dioxygenase